MNSTSVLEQHHEHYLPSCPTYVTFCRELCWYYLCFIAQYTSFFYETSRGTVSRDFFILVFSSNNFSWSQQACLETISIFFENSRRYSILSNNFTFFEYSRRYSILLCIADVYDISSAKSDIVARWFFWILNGRHWEVVSIDSLFLLIVPIKALVNCQTVYGALPVSTTPVMHAFPEVLTPAKLHHWYQRCWRS